MGLTSRAETTLSRARRLRRMSSQSRASKADALAATEADTQEVPPSDLGDEGEAA